MQNTLDRPISLTCIPLASDRRVVAAPGRALAAVAGLLLTWQRRARQRADLAGMSDRMLADIGVTRAEAMHEVAKPFWTR